MVGPGAIGGAVAAWLCDSGRHEVTLCARRPLPGLEVLTPEKTIAVQPRVVTDPREAKPVDWILVATKAYDAPGAAAWFGGLAGGATRVAILQNGLDHRERFAPYIDASRLVPVIVTIGCERTASGQIRVRDTGRLTVADDAAGRDFAALFAGTPLPVALTDDFKSVAWKKLCLNAVGVISALVSRPAGVMREPAMAELGRALAREGIAVGRAEGARLDDALADEIVAGYQQAPVEAMNSLHADFAAGRPTELDARNGIIVRLGHKHGLATPCNQMAVALLEAMTKR